MAQRPHDQQQLLLAQDPYAFMLGQQMSQTAILDSNEQGMMEHFFSNPEEAMSDNGLSYANVDGAPNPFSVFAEVANSSSHANSRAHVEAAAHGYALGSNEAWLSSPSEVQNAASTLTSFHPGPHHHSGNMDYTGSWGSMSAANNGANMGPFYQNNRATGQNHQQQQQPQYSYPISGEGFSVPPTWQQHSQNPNYPNRARHLSIDTSSQAVQQQMQMGPQGMRSAMPEMQSRSSTFTFGTDQSFSPSGYQAPNNKALLLDREGDLLNIPYTALITNNAPTFPAQSASARPSMGDMRPRHSHNAGPRIGNAAGGARPMSAHHHGSSWDGGSRAFAADNQNGDEAYDQQPRKRRKGRPENDDDDQPAGQLSSSAKKQAKMETSDDDRAPNAGGAPKRRKSTHARGGVASPQSMASSDAEDDADDNLSASKKKDKKPRQNLSDVQKRQNHIMSEKKRRELIKTGYADLNELVPALVGGKTGMSRSESLFECQTYLESLIEGSKHVMQALGITLRDIKIAEDLSADRDENYAD